MKRAVSLFLVFAFALLIFSTTAFVEPIFAYNFDDNGTQPYDDSTQSYNDASFDGEPYNAQSYDDSAQPYEPSNNNLDDEVDGISDNVLRATFSTTYSNSSPNRKHNIKLAASKLNITLYPDEIFSFNRIVGERSEARGFLTAHIILDGKFVDGVGGGVCQVSTTLYNCALLSDLEILCAHRHSLPVSYVAPSF
ncbi:MAG TPA: VanW family protein, partial [Clostridia bacterium]|nr:VanW family protein [Clostridia bacterium]